MAEIPLSVDPSKSTGPIRDLADALQEVQDQTVKTEKQFSDTFGTSTKAVDKTTQAIDDQTKAQRQSAEALDSTRKGVVDFSKSSKKAYDSKGPHDYTKAVKEADNATDKLDKSTDEFGKSSGTVFEGLSEGLGEIGGQFGDLGAGVLSGQGGGGLISGLQGALGKIGPIGMGLAAVIGTAVALGSEIIDIDQKFDKLRGTVESLFKVTGEEADHIVVSVEAIANTFDQDVDEVIIATNTLVKEFGISAEEASSLLSRGFNSAANAQGDLIDSVKEFSSQVRASGGDAEDLFSVLAKSNQEGIFSDKGIDVVKEFGLRIREQTQGTVDALSNAFGADFTDNLLKGVNEGSISSIDALAKVSKELGTLSENSAATQTVIADVFGGPGEDAGYRFLTLLEDINTEQGFGNEQLTEQQKRQQENLEANQRLAAAQNELSKAIGDSSAIGRIWTDIQTFFISLLVDLINFVNDVSEAFESWGNFQEFVIKQTLELAEALSFGLVTINTTTIEWENLTKAEKENIRVKSEAIKAIRDYGKETGVLVSKLEKSFKSLQEGTLTDESRLKLVKELNEQYPEQIGNVNLLKASEEELLQVKKDIIKAEVEGDIARKKRFALAQLELQLEQRRAQLQNVRNEKEREELLKQLEVFEQQAKERIDLVEEEVKIQLGLIERVNDDIIAEEEDKTKTIAKIDEGAQKEREKQLSEFNKAIQEILKRGKQAELNDQFVSEEQRIKMQRDFQRDELANLLKHAQDLNETLKGTRELDQEVIDAFNRADEKIITDAQDKIDKIYREAAERQRQIRLQESVNILGIQQQLFDQELANLEAQQKEEIALIDQQEKRRGESTLEFQNRIELEKLDTQAFYLAQRIALIDQEQELKLLAINNELLAIEGKEGAEVEAKRKALEDKKKLLQQETDAQRAELDLQLKNTEDAISTLENRIPTLGEVFDKIGEKIAESLGLTPEQVQAIVGAVQQVAGEIFNTIQQSVQDQLAANDELLSQLSDRSDQTKEELDREIEYAKLGYASNVALKRQELAQIEAAEADANKKREELVQQQQQLDTVSQTVSLITASANLYKSLSVLPFGIGIGIATALTGAMFGAFIAAKAKAQNITTLETGGQGDSTGIIKGRRHYQGGENFLDHIEVEHGERWSVYNRRGSSKYADIIRDFTEAVNTDNVAKFMHKRQAPQIFIAKSNEAKGEELQLQALTISADLGHHLSSIPEIKKVLDKKFNEPKTFFYQDKDGNTVKYEQKPNGGTKKTRLSD